MRKKPLSTFILLAILGAWALVLRQFDFPILPHAPFLKVDLSDLAVLGGLIVKGPSGMLAVAGIRDLLNYIMKGGEAGYPIGAVMSIIASIAFFIPTHWALKGQLKRLNLFSVYSVISLTVVTAVLNYFVALPLYIAILNFPIPSIGQFVLGITIPFNIIKGILLAVAQGIALRTLLPLITKRGYLFQAYQSSSS